MHTQRPRCGDPADASGSSSLIPLDTLFADPSHAAPAVSPDGSHLAWIAPHTGVPNLWVRSVGQDDDGPVTADTGRGIRGFHWWPDSTRLGYLQDNDGDEQWRLFDVDLSGERVRALTPAGVRAEVIAAEPAVPDRVLIGLYQRNPQLPDLYELHLGTGQLTLVLENPGLLGFKTDRHLRARAAVAPLPDGGLAIMAREADEGAVWRPLLTVGQPDALTAPIGFNQDGTRLLAVTSADANASRLVWIDTTNGAVETVAADGTYDVANAITEHVTNTPQAVGFQRERLVWQALTAQGERDLAMLGALDDGDLTSLSRDDHDQVWVAGFSRADGPTRYYLVQRATGRAEMLFADRPELDSLPLAAMEPFSYPARDGLTIHGYLTFPRNCSRTGLPTVLVVHGGPWARDTWGFSPLVQMLANRGYLVVQVNFRGSTGYGKKFMNAGDRQWAGAMHHDLIDAVGHVIEAGYADPGRVGVFGASYGGYAALVAASFTPEVFAAAASLCGPSNLETLIRSFPEHWQPMIAQYLTRVGDPDTEPEFLWSRSPLSRVGEIRSPLLIGQGGNDPRVTPHESDQIVKALTERGRPPEYLFFDDEGHGLVRRENRLRFFAALEAFFSAHLGGQCATVKRP